MDGREKIGRVVRGYILCILHFHLILHLLDLQVKKISFLLLSFSQPNCDHLLDLHYVHKHEPPKLKPHGPRSHPCKWKEGMSLRGKEAKTVS